MMDRFFLKHSETIFVLIDIQEKLAAAMKMKDAVVENCLHLIELSKLLDIPVVLTEQYPRGLGRTLDEIRKAIPSYEPFEKTSFDCCSEAGFIPKVSSYGRNSIVLAGMESHICILQTALGLLTSGYAVQVPADAVCSRKKGNHKTAMHFIRDAGGVITATETVLFQLLERAGTEAFKTISKRIR